MGEVIRMWRNFLAWCPEVEGEETGVEVQASDPSLAALLWARNFDSEEGYPIAQEGSIYIVRVQDKESEGVFYFEVSGRLDPTYETRKLTHQEVDEAGTK